MFGPNGDEIMRDLRGLYYEEFHDLYSSSNFVRLVNSRKM